MASAERSFPVRPGDPGFVMLPAEPLAGIPPNPASPRHARSPHRGKVLAVKSARFSHGLSAAFYAQGLATAASGTGIAFSPSRPPDPQAAPLLVKARSLGALFGGKLSTATHFASLPEFPLRRERQHAGAFQVLFRKGLVAALRVPV